MAASSILELIDFHDTSRLLSQDEKKDFTRNIWDAEMENASSDLSAYFQFLQCERNLAKRQHIKFTFKEVSALRDFLCDHHDKGRDEILRKVQTSRLISVPDHSLETIMKLVIRSFLFVRIEFCNSRASLHSGVLSMLQNESLCGILREFGSIQPFRGGSVGDQYPEWFNVIDLERKAGMRIRWTDYITDHLTIQGGTLLLFRHTEALKYIEKSATLTSKFLDKDFFAETLRSVLLFFPLDGEGLRLSALDYGHWMGGSEAPENWQSQILIDSRDKGVSRSSNEYPVWHQRLGYVLEVSQSQNNLTLSRIWNDDRDQALWWTRWALITAAFFAILFGLIQSITGIIQVT